MASAAGPSAPPGSAGKSAWVLQSFNGQMGDVYTQAHELGHAVHAYLGSRHQKPSNYEIGSCIAECGSVFGELLLTDRLLAKAKTKEEKQAVLATVLDEFGMAALSGERPSLLREEHVRSHQGGQVPRR